MVWQGALWLFRSAENLARFKTEPERYAPAFGGFCAYCAASGHKMHADPTVWVIVDGKLYLHVNNDLRDTWRKDPTRYIKDAGDRWPEVQAKTVPPDTTAPFSERLLAISH